MGNITVVGMGPGGFGWMTVEAWEAIQNADLADGDPPDGRGDFPTGRRLLLV